MMINILFVMADFAFVALNVYLGLTGSGNTAINWAAVAFCSGIGILQIAIYLKDGDGSG